MNIPVEFFIIAAAVIGASISFVVTAFFVGAKRNRIERDTWNQARLFYERQSNPSARRI
jgi:ABC-type multidrug transport system permease subunit